MLAPWLLKCGGPDAYVFSPPRAEAERNATRSEARVTERWPSHMRRNAGKRVKGRRWPPGDRYNTQTVRQAVERAGISVITSHQLRHLTAHDIRAEFGLDVAGPSSATRRPR